MFKTRFILFFAAILLVAGMFALPKFVVDNDKEAGVDQPAEKEVSSEQLEAIENAHTGPVSKDITVRIALFRDSLALAGNSEKSIIFADSLAGLYRDVNKPDSAATFIEIIAKADPSMENFLRLGDAYYEAYGFAAEPSRRAALAAEARESYMEVLEEDPANLFVKNRVAMTWLASNTPMQGILMLREIVQEDPGNEQAIFNLGVLSMQSGQYDRAVERFEALVEVNPSNMEAQFFLGVSYLETGKKGKARKQFEFVKEHGKDEEAIGAAESYLESIK